MSYLYDCHVHTSETSSCGLISGAEMAELYAAAGYTGIVITDHYFDFFFETAEGSWTEKIDKYLAGFSQAAKRGKELGLKVLLGLELRFKGSSEDYLVYGVDRQFLLEHPRLDLLGLAKFFALAEEKGLFLAQAHPFRPGLKAAPAELLHGMEVYNGNPRHNNSNHLAVAYAEKHNLVQLACSDAHQYTDIARGGLYLPEITATGGELVEVLQKNRRLPSKTS